MSIGTGNIVPEEGQFWAPRSNEDGSGAMRIKYTDDYIAILVDNSGVEHKFGLFDLVIEYFEVKK